MQVCHCIGYMHSGVCCRCRQLRGRWVWVPAWSETYYGEPYPNQSPDVMPRQPYWAVTDKTYTHLEQPTTATDTYWGPGD